MKKRHYSIQLAKLLVLVVTSMAGLCCTLERSGAAESEDVSSSDGRTLALVFQPGETVKLIRITALEDQHEEPTETLRVDLADVSRAVIDPKGAHRTVEIKGKQDQTGERAEYVYETEQPYSGGGEDGSGPPEHPVHDDDVPNTNINTDSTDVDQRDPRKPYLVMVPPVSKEAMQGSDVRLVDAVRVLWEAPDSRGQLGRLIGVPMNQWAKAEDIVYKQFPLAGTLVPPGTEVRLWDIRAEVPTVVGKTLGEAHEILNEVHHFVVEYHENKDGQYNTKVGSEVFPVTGQSVETPERWWRGETEENGGEAPGPIVLKSKTKMPDIIGQSAKEAMDILLKEHLQPIPDHSRSQICNPDTVEEAYYYTDDGERVTLESGVELNCGTDVFFFARPPTEQGRLVID